jgi:hypothetical protein
MAQTCSVGEFEQNASMFGGAVFKGWSSRISGNFSSMPALPRRANLSGSRQDVIIRLGNRRIAKRCRCRIDCLPIAKPSMSVLNRSGKIPARTYESNWSPVWLVR